MPRRTSCSGACCASRRRASIRSAPAISRRPGRSTSTTPKAAHVRPGDDRVGHRPVRGQRALRHAELPPGPPVLPGDPAQPSRPVRRGARSRPERIVETARRRGVTGARTGRSPSSARSRWRASSDGTSSRPSSRAESRSTGCGAPRTRFRIAGARRSAGGASRRRGAGGPSRRGRHGRRRGVRLLLRHAGLDLRCRRRRRSRSVCCEDARRLQRHVMTGAERAQNPWARARGLLLGALVSRGPRRRRGARGGARPDGRVHRLEEIWTRRDRAAGRPGARAGDRDRSSGPTGWPRVSRSAAARRCSTRLVERLASETPAGDRAAFAACSSAPAGSTPRSREAAGGPGRRRWRPGWGAVRLCRPPLQLGGSAGSWSGAVARRFRCRPSAGSAPGRCWPRCLCNPGPVHREQLLDWLWPDLDVERGLRAFHVTLHSLRRAIEPEIDRRSTARSIVRVRGRGLPARALGRRRDRRSTTSWAALRPPRRERVAAEARCRLLDAEGAYTGPLFPEWPYAEWAQSSAGARSIGPTRPCWSGWPSRSAPGMHREARLRWERLVALEPEREAFHRNLMLRYAEAGEKALALRQYHACRAVLRRELGVEASPETRGALPAHPRGQATSPTERWRPPRSAPRRKSGGSAAS